MFASNPWFAANNFPPAPTSLWCVLELEVSLAAPIAAGLAVVDSLFIECAADRPGGRPYP